MRFDSVLAEIRFGCGLSPAIAPPVSVAQMLGTLTAPDVVADRFPIETFAAFEIRVREGVALNTVRREARGSPMALDAEKAIRVLKQVARKAQTVWLGQHLNRWVATHSPLRERLTLFWADHFTAMGKAGLIRRATSPYIETAIRPHICGLFEDLLCAAVLHPLMIHYLDQEGSVGPNSEKAARGGRRTGLNENLAREVMELHTLGVGAPYTQADVRELAELLTGVTHTREMRFQFRKQYAEPGPETVLGKTYGGGPDAQLHDVQAVLRDLARHPATARHLATKLAVHFVSDTPDPALVDTLAARYMDTGGDLGAVTAALLAHPAAWAPDGGNIKPPFNFIASALRALALPPEALAKLEEQGARRLILRPMAEMGHLWEKPAGPDGLPEQDSAWTTPQNVAARLQWAIAVPQQLIGTPPDPRLFVHSALGTLTTPAVEFAATAAESRWDGVGLVLASPAFQRT